MLEYVQCRKCLNKNKSLKSGKPIAEPGYIVEEVLGTDGKTMVDHIVECECHKAWRRKQQLMVAAKHASLSPRWIDFNPETDYVGEESKANVERIMNYVKRSTDKNETEDVKIKLASSVIYIYGKNGTQKTTLANWMGYEFLKAKKTVKYILMNDLIKMLQKADRNEDYVEQLEKLSDVDLLLIDEAFDKEKVTIYASNFQIPFLDTFLRNRIQTRHKGIVFISNVSPYDIEEKGFNHSIQDLVLRNLSDCNGLMEFVDRYDSIKSSIDVDKLF